MDPRLPVMIDRQEAFQVLLVLPEQLPIQLQLPAVLPVEIAVDLIVLAALPPVEEVEKINLFT